MPRVTQPVRSKNPGFLAASPSHLMALCFSTCCSRPLDCPSLSPLQNLHVIFKIYPDVASPRRLLWWQSMSCCVFLVLAFLLSLLYPIRPIQTLKKKSDLSTRGRHLQQKINNAGEMLVGPIRVRQENNPAQVFRGILTKGLFIELGDRLKETG